MSIFWNIRPYAVYISNVICVPRGKWSNEDGSLYLAHKLTASMVMNPSPAVRFVYRPKMNALLTSDKLDGVVGIVPLPSDTTVGTAVANNSMHTNIPTILYFMIFFPLVTNRSGVCYLMDSYLNVWKR